MNKNIALAVSGLVLAMGTAVNAQSIYTSSGNSVLIPDNNATGATLDIVIGDSGIIADMNVGLVITHTWQGDLTATLEHVGFGGPVLLINRPGFPLSTFGYSADNYGNVAGAGTYFVLDDEAAAIYDRPPGGGPNNTTGTGGVTGSWIPDGGLLSAFDGQNISGTWRLKVTDHVASDSGAIRNLQLNFIIPGPASAALLGVAGLLGIGRRRRA